MNDTKISFLMYAWIPVIASVVFRHPGFMWVMWIFQAVFLTLFVHGITAHGVDD